jgi:hypothetical protein
MRRSDKKRPLTTAVTIDGRMKIAPLSLAFFSLLLAAFPNLTGRCATQEGVALAIVYDTSGSMKDPVRDQSGRFAPKYVIANRALDAIASRIQMFATNTVSGVPRTIEAGLFIFSGTGATQAVKFGPFDAAALHEYARKFSNPAGATPLGNALKTATRAVLDSPLPHKHVLVITDGMNTAGPQPTAVLPSLKQDAQAKQATFSVHFVAFDVDARIFDGIKKLGGTVVGAADEKQLNSQLEFILQRKILLEDEEPQKHN